MRQTILVSAVMLLLSPPLAMPQCARKVAMATYSACFPSGWQVFTDTGLDQVSACNKKQGRCTGTGGGFPLKGVVFVFLTPVEKLPGHPNYGSVEQIAESGPHAGMPSPAVIPVELGNEKGKRKCVVARRMMSPALGFWDETYGLEVDGHLFRGWVQYPDEDADKVEAYRRAVREILSSVSVGSTAPSK